MLISEYFSCVNYNPLVLEPLASFSLRPKFSSVRQLFPPVIFLPPILCVRTDGGRGQPIPPCPLLAIPTIWGEGVGGYRKCCTAPLGPNRKTLPLPGKFATLPCISKCHIFVQFSLPGMKNSPVGNLLTRLNDTVFIFGAKKQSKRENVRDIWLLHN